MPLSNSQILERYSNVGVIRLKPTADQHFDLMDFLKNLPARWPRYKAVADATGIPAALISAIHWREASGSFNTYLAQGDPLGKPPVHVPTEEPTTDSWLEAAVFALGVPQQAAAKANLGLTANMTFGPSDWSALAKMLAFAEIYNGTGYANRGVASPYVLAGTSGYNGGKYVADGVYDPNFHDQQVGCLPMIWAATNTTPTN